MTKLAIPQDILQGTTGMQKYIMERLHEKGAGIDEILDDIIEISKGAEKVTPIGEMVDDHQTRFQAKKLLLELMGVYKSKGGINMKFDIGSLLYGGNKNGV